MIPRSGILDDAALRSLSAARIVAGWRRWPLALLLSIASIPSIAVAVDCDENGVDDAVQIEDGSADDCDQNGILDTCQTTDPVLHYGPASSFGIPDAATAIETADFNADGLADIVLAHRASDRVTVLIRESASGFDAPDAMPAAKPTRLGVGDLNGDGHVDIVASSGSVPSLIVYFNGGPGWFAAPRLIRLPASTGHPSSLRVADIDGDGRQDIVLAFPSGPAILRQGEAGQIGDFELIDDGPVIRTVVDFHVVDLDRDGDLDLLFSESFGLRVIENLGAGRFEPNGTTLRLSGVAQNLAIVDSGLPTGPEILYSTVRAVGLLRNPGGLTLDIGGFEVAPPLISNPVFVFGLRAGDFDGDGAPDLAVLRDSRATVFAGGETPGEFQFQESVPFTNSTPSLFAVGDLDGDGFTEIVAAPASPPGVVRIASPEISPRFTDCNDNGILDACEIEADPSLDCGDDGILDECEPDLNNNGLSDDCEEDCNRNGIPDDLDIAEGPSRDCNDNAIPDDCEEDCDFDEVPDECQRLSGFDDCNSNGVLDGCEADCNLNQIPDECEIDSGAELDENVNGIPDSCEPERSYWLGFSGPSRVDAITGSPSATPVYAQLHLLPGADPVQGWSVSISSSCEVALATVEGTVGADVNDDPPGQRNVGFERTEIVAPGQMEGYGAVSTVVLSFAMPITLDPTEAPYRILRLDTIAEPEPEPDGSCSECALSYSDGLFIRRSGQPVNNTITANGAPRTPGLGSFRFEVCPRPFFRGDATGEGALNISDGIAIFGFLFLGDAAPSCLEAADANDDARLDIADGIAILSYLFVDGAAPPAPGPPGPDGCSVDPADSPGYLGCEAYTGCVD